MKRLVLVFFLGCASVAEPTASNPIRGRCYYNNLRTRWERVTIYGVNPGNIDESVVKFDERQFDPFYRGKTFNVPTKSILPCKDSSLDRMFAAQPEQR